MSDVIHSQTAPQLGLLQYSFPCQLSRHYQKCQSASSSHFSTEQPTNALAEHFEFKFLSWKKLVCKSSKINRKEATIPSSGIREVNTYREDKLCTNRHSPPSSVAKCKHRPLERQAGRMNCSTVNGLESRCLGNAFSQIFWVCRTSHTCPIVQCLSLQLTPADKSI